MALATENTDEKNTGKSSKNASQDEFIALEKKLFQPQGINQKFDIWMDVVRSIPSDEKIFFTQNLGIMLKSGLAASRAFRTLTLQANNPKFKRILARITRLIEKGQPIATAMKNYPKAFSPIFVSMIRAGEASGQLESVLAELTRQLKNSHELKAKVKGALMYPLAILIAMVGIGAGMLLFVIPKLTAIFSEMNVDLPLPTRILIFISNNVNEYIYIVAPALVVGAGLLVYLTRRGPGQKLWHTFILHLPIVKKIAIKINLAKISRTLSSLLATDMPIVDSFKLTSDVVKNVLYRESLQLVAVQVEKGETISDQLSKLNKLYTPVAIQMIRVGEETGEISNILNQLAEFYEEDVKQTMESLPTIIEPVLIVLLGGAVGGMAVAVILPMFSLTNAV
jgi:type IV pilus assembly protein PilC